LIETVENKLLSLLPEKERLKHERIKQKATLSDILEAEKEVSQWQSQVLEREKLLKKNEGKDKAPTRKAHPNEIILETGSNSKKKALPPVRGSKTATSAVVSDEMKENQNPSQRSTLVTETKPTYNESIIAELLKSIQVREDQRMRMRSYTDDITAASKRSKSFVQDMQKQLVKHKVDEMSIIQRSITAERERLKGNESYRAGENDKAYDFYSTSIALDANLSITYANRAMVSIRMQRLEEAEDDCERSLVLDSSYVKAWSRRGMIRYKKGRYIEAAYDFAEAIYRDRDNQELLALYEKAREKALEVVGKSLDLQTIMDELHCSSSASTTSSPESTARSTSRAPANGTEGWHDVAQVASWKDLSLMSSAAVESSSGTCEITSAPDAHDNQEPTGEYTRVIIQEEDDEDDVEVAGESNEAFTRVQITEDDDDDEVVEAPEESSRVNITEEDEEEEATPPTLTPAAPVVEAQTESAAVLWKNRGNGFLSQGKAVEAVEAYTKSLDLDPSLIASRSNRVVAYITLQRYQDAIHDAKIILESDPRHIKARYRRAQALHLHASSNLDRFDERYAQHLTQAIDDLRQLLAIEAENQEAKSLINELEQHLLKLAMAWKDQGNDAMKQSQYAVAIDCYSKAIDIDPKNLLFYNNRAQAYLKTNRFVDAEHDASHVIHHSSTASASSDDNDKDGQLKKALFRRALARRGQGDVMVNGKSSLEQAADDLKRLITLEASNKTAELEYDRTMQMIRERSKNVSSKQTTAAKPPPSSAASGSSASASIDLKPLSTRRRDPSAVPITTDAPTSSSTSTSPAKLSPASPAAATTATSSASTRSPAAATKSSTTSTAGQLKDPAMPSEAPKTEYEFERIWRSLRHRPDLFIKYLECFKASTFKKIFKASISADLLSSILSTIDIYADSRSSLTYKLLHSLSQIASFDMTIALLPADDMVYVRSIFTKLSATDQADQAAALEGRYLTI
jgi:tetratricopeptide (TPR) repeat protein